MLPGPLPVNTDVLRVEDVGGADFHLGLHIVIGEYLLTVFCMKTLNYFAHLTVMVVLVYDLQKDGELLVGELPLLVPARPVLGGALLATTAHKLTVDDHTYIYIFRQVHLGSLQRHLDGDKAVKEVSSAGKPCKSCLQLSHTDTRPASVQ